MVSNHYSRLICLSQQIRTTIFLNFKTVVLYYFVNGGLYTTTTVNLVYRKLSIFKKEIFKMQKSKKDGLFNLIRQSKEKVEITNETWLLETYDEYPNTAVYTLNKDLLPSAIISSNPIGNTIYGKALFVDVQPEGKKQLYDLCMKIAKEHGKKVLCIYNENKYIHKNVDAVSYKAYIENPYALNNEDYDFVIVDECDFFASESMGSIPERTLHQIIDQFSCTRLYVTSFPEDCFTIIYTVERKRHRHITDYQIMNIFSTFHDYDFMNLTFFCKSEIINTMKNRNNEKWAIFGDYDDLRFEIQQAVDFYDNVFLISSKCELPEISQSNINIIIYNDDTVAVKKILEKVKSTGKRINLYFYIPTVLELELRREKTVHKDIKFCKIIQNTESDININVPYVEEHNRFYMCKLIKDFYRYDYLIENMNELDYDAQQKFYANEILSYFDNTSQAIFLKDIND